MKLAATIDGAEDGQTLAAVLRARMAGISWSRARTLIERGKVTLGGRRALDPARRVKAGQALTVDETAPTPALSPPVHLVFEDAHVVVLDKPSGVSSVPYDKRESGTAMDLVREAWRGAGRRATVQPLYVVHRIDKETSGLLAFAKTKLAERALGGQFRAHEIERSYSCVVHGLLTDRRIETRLVSDRGDGLRGSTRHLNQGKRAVTHVRVVEEFADCSLCEVRLETGKTHQIRIHLAEGGHPLVGERVYIRDFTRKGGEPIDCPRLLLHAATLGFAHPVSGEEIRLEAPLPPDFRGQLRRLRRRTASPSPGQG